MPTKDDAGRWQWLGARVRNLHAAQLDRLLEQVDANWNELADSKDRAVIEPTGNFRKGYRSRPPHGKSAPRAWHAAC